MSPEKNKDSPLTEHPDVVFLRTTYLYRFIDPYHYSLFLRAAVRLEREFLQVSFSKKIKFIIYLFRWFFYKFIKKIKKIFFSVARPVLSQTSSEVLFAAQFQGGIGDLVNASAFLTALYENKSFPKLDLYFHNTRALQFVFSKAPFVNKLFDIDTLKTNSKNYDLILTITDWLEVEVNTNKKLHPLSLSIEKIFKNKKNNFQHYDLYLRKRYLFKGYYAYEMVRRGFNRISAPGYFLDLAISKTHLKIYPDHPSESYLASQSLTPHTYITIHDGFDNDFVHKTHRSTKQWSLAHWENLCRLLQDSFPHLRIIQLGAKTSRPIPGITDSFINKTSLEEAAFILKNSKLHIDGESGLARIAAALQTPCITLFGPTNFEYFAIAGNINLKPQACGGCNWFSDDWMSECPRGFKQPECLESTLPDAVFKKAQEILIRYADYLTLGKT
ncbi:MAG: hypothetical protein A3G71_03265 [Gammaproteobacteria bacterium RIFCSPLOWO2_12_FULL_38_14]|nr:MAG: hypothetical protein A3G71_03265 [Gammaproteobacteria bacterium RIFCSPLOWO2_12_FULL_38_14]